MGHLRSFLIPVHVAVIHDRLPPNGADEHG